MNDSQLVAMDATSIASAIQNKQVTCKAAVSAYIAHILNVNPNINAMVEDRFDAAIYEANELDQMLARGEVKGPLHGVPISVKESLHVAEMKTTGGLEHRQDLISRVDAEVVGRLKKAGAIILGKTNTPALCFCQETENKLYGRTNNPWDTNRTAGGSSGGEGALLAVGGAAAGIGSDIGGSIRFPAHFNGIVGFKPGMFTISNDGHFPAVIHALQARMLTIGPMGKSVQDMRLFYQILSGISLDPKPLNRFRIEVLPSTIDYPLSEKTKLILNQVELFLEKTFSTKQSIPPYFRDSALIWQEIMSMEGSKLIEQEAYNNDRSSVYTSFFKEKLTQRTKVHPYLSWAIMGAKMFRPSRKRIREVESIIEQGDELLKTYLKNRLLIFPVYHSGALRHGQVFKEIFSIRKTFLQYMPYAAYANVWGLPALTIPVGTDENNMPISIQIMSSTGNEDAIFRLGRLIEKKFRGYVLYTTETAQQSFM
ncbi:amidase [Oceanobacillus polygoni]|uniref:Asp-tRNA(Asn)/Glu-tRNA(Gln) amidotransferase A subunit family amidase n=1 Tax=Oceanobacillus polygoni TaxID=1235259 RepID=A0A9X0YR92_9BACI|nr:amidase [Oceanobacillus polygoni]MBP2076477.1 Asp-tRNA(Asn)/Glu-tRNA(Gln) amidotransferase A subunit family amidase [Oceanobacillus polygoni]